MLGSQPSDMGSNPLRVALSVSRVADRETRDGTRPRTYNGVVSSILTLAILWVSKVVPPANAQPDDAKHNQAN